MNTSISFYSKVSGSAIDIETSDIGLNALDRARREVGTGFDMELMKPTIGFICTDPSMDVSESYARYSDRFKDVSRVRVMVSRSSLNRFVVDYVDVRRNQGDDAIKEVRIVRKVDTNAILEAWKTAGYPIEWAPTE